jgi:hypothetical protein
MTNRGMILSLTIGLIAVGATSIGAGDLHAQGTWPGQAGPIPGLIGAQGPIVDNGVPQVGVAVGPFPQAAGLQDQCATDYQPLRDEAERRGKLIKDASQRHATPEEACRLIKSFGQAETKMIIFVESHMAKCGIPSQVADQLKNGHKNTETMQTKVCAMVQRRGPAGPVGDFDFPSIR